MTTTSIGRKAEFSAVEYLVRQGFQVVDQNWRTRWCEIDIVAVKGRSVTLVEVKYRRRDNWGRGLEYITRTKHRQMSFAAEFWMASHDWPGECYLSAIEVSGSDFEVTAFIPEI